MGGKSGGNVQWMLTPKTKQHLVTLFAILGFLWVIMYAIPSIFVQLFDTAIGNAILVLAVAMVMYKHRNFGIALGIGLVIAYQFSHMSHGYTGLL